MDADRNPRPQSRLYRALLLLFPADVRTRFGDDMAELFARQLAHTRGWSRLRLYQRAVADAARHGLGERIERLRQPAPRRGAPYTSRWWMDTLRHDLRHAVRMLLRQPGMTATILLTLALGIGANTAVFSVVHAVLLRPLPYVEPERLVMVWEKRPVEGVMNNVVSPADYLDWSRRSTSFTSMAAHSTALFDLTGAGEPVQLSGALVTAGFFDVLGTKVQHGRTFTSGEDIAGRDRVVVLSHPVWRDRFGSDPGIVGRSIRLNDVSHEVIGVLPADFEGGMGERTPTPGELAAIWAPLVLQEGSASPTRTNHFLNVYARLAPGVSIESAGAEMDHIGAQLSREYPTENQNHGAHVVSLREEIVRPVRAGLLVVMSAVAFLLLIACTNVANLLLARGAGRRREMAIRSAIGAARGRLLRQALTESLLLSTIGGAVGLAVAWWTIKLLVAETPPALRAAGLERAQLDIPVLAFTVGVCFVVGLIAGVLPAWQGSRHDPADPLREGGRSPMSLKRRVRFALIATEVALTVLLLVGAGLMLRSLLRVLSQPAGVETANRLTLTLTLPRARYGDAAAVRRAGRALAERLNSIPAVIAAGANNNPPLTGSDSRRGISIDGYQRGEGDPPTRAHTRIVTPRYFEAAGISLKQGRGFEPRDDDRASLVVVINETMARRYWSGQNPVGKRVRFVGDDPWREVIGVITDVRHWGLDQEVNPELYMPHAQQPSLTMTFVLHTASDPTTIVAAARNSVDAVDPNLPFGDLRTMEQVAEKSVAARRWSALLLSMFAGLGVLLAGAGIYGVMAHLVSMRTAEIGIRMTLGARPSGVLRQVLAEAVTHAAVGLVAGLIAAMGAMRALQSLLFEVTPADPTAFAGAALMVLVVTAAAAFVPALRAMRIDPVTALRTD